MKSGRRTPAAARSNRLLLEPGRSPRCGLFASCAGVHVDFHAHRHLDNLRSLPGHSGLPSIMARRSSRGGDGKATSKVTQVFTSTLCVAQICNDIFQLGGISIQQISDKMISRRPGSEPLIEIFDLRTISTIATAPVRRWYLVPWHPGFHPCPDLPH